MAVKNRQIVSTYGTMWARNKQNVKRLEKDGKLNGVYVLCDGSMPVYVGQGRLIKRLEGHQRSKKRGQFWDHFSWFAIPNRMFQNEIEALLLSLLPFYLRSLNRQTANLKYAQRVREANPVAELIKRPKFAFKRKRL